MLHLVWTARGCVIPPHQADRRYGSLTNDGDLEARLRLVEDRLAILDVLTAYSQALDAGDELAFLECFTADAVYDVTFPRGFDASGFPPRGGEQLDFGLRFRGHDGLGEFVRGHTRAPSVLHKHFAVNPKIEIRGAAATSVSYLLRLDVGIDGAVFARSFGRYVDDLVRNQEGTWRLSYRRAMPDVIDMQPYRQFGELDARA
jgi:hypothetical protein